MKLIILIVLIIGVQQISAQKYPIKNDFKSNSQNSAGYDILNEVETGISQAELSEISPYLSSNVYLSFLNGISGYYSSNQAYYILEDFFNEYKAISFKFENININTTIPFAKGTYYYEHKGNRLEAKVYLTMKLAGKSWQITQISID